MIIDLTHPIVHGLPVYPGDAETKLVHDRQLRRDHYNNHLLTINMHAGTHMDGPMHLTDSTTYLYDYPVERFIGEGCLINAVGEREIGYKRDYETLIQEESIVIVHTGHGRLFGQPGYFDDYPVLTVPFAELLVRKRVKIVGLDTPSPDRYPFEVHHSLFANDVLIVENLANVDKLLEADAFEITALPLRIRADSSIARIIARVKQP
ncbi:cyclase family protein [Paenibacillus methanolicus]|uniref:Kynurenine formamidase n=1 Tax=Paenibacillus methanolicus TaxID=582686 RepID=A0A5S5C2D0_9BACL|nr:cyclase family protein [Paenibacillus methanolicus]TYP72490.1 kynurenine formamidase [Paenibacillus methanolicus]